MADDTAEAPEQEQELPDEASEQEAPAGAGGEGGWGWSRRRVLLTLTGLTAASFVVSGLVALSAGGHFQRRPLCALRRVPVVGRLIAPAPEPKKPEPAQVPSAAAMHPMPAMEISELIAALQKARETCDARQEALRSGEERLRALQEDLGRERDHLEGLMARLSQRQSELEARRKELDEHAVVVQGEERKRLTQLARIYEAQEPDRGGPGADRGGAAGELAALARSSNDGLAVKVLASMTEKKAAPIFDAMEPEAAAALKTQLCSLRFERAEKRKEGTP
jgi:flagellar motility protein MotE (MotC chaperone)